MKITTIKVVRIIVLFMLFAQNIYGQQQLGQGSGGIAIASPSMASMALYTDTPVNLSSGIPEINFPIVDIPISDQNVKNTFSLSYNPTSVNTNLHFPAGDVGLGWSLFGGSMIYKKIVNKLDERFDDNSVEGYQKNIFDDVYYYNLPGLSGKFQIKRDTVSNTFSLINLTPNNARFEYERENNTATLKIKSFTVTDGKGYKYYFDDFDYETVFNGGITLGVGYRPAHFLSKITSPTGKIIAIYTYEKKSKEAGYLDRLLYQYCKPKTIETDQGQIIFDYAYDETLKDTPNDLYSLQKITLKNKAGQQISSYTFNYILSSIPSTPKEQKRLLASITKNGRNDVKLEQTSFLYNQNLNYNNPATNPSICDWGGSIPDSFFDTYQFTNVLEKVILPTGGVTAYDFGFNDMFFNYDEAYLESILYGYVDSSVQYVEKQPAANFETTQSSVYTFTITGNPSKKVGFYISFHTTGYRDPREPRDPLNPGANQPPFYTNYKIKNSAGEYLNRKSCVFGGAESSNTYYGYPGTYTMEISGTGHGYGNYQVSEVRFKPQPYKNVKKTPSIAPRINNIKYYKSIHDTEPVRTVNYNYDSEDGTGSSGSIFNQDSDSPHNPFQAYVLTKM